MKATKRKSRDPASQTGARKAILTPDDSPLNQLAESLLKELLAETDNPILQGGLRRAAAEAESLAWMTPYPLLVLPALMQEKARAARRYAARQAEVREASREWLTLSE